MDDQFDFANSHFPVVTKALVEFLRAGHPMPIGRKNLGQAARTLDLSRLPWSAFVEAVIAAEQAVASVVTAMKLESGVSKERLARVKKDLTFSYMLNVELGPTAQIN